MVNQITILDRDTACGPETELTNSGFLLSISDWSSAADQAYLEGTGNSRVPMEAP